MGVIYGAGQKGTFYALDADTGQAYWSFDLVSQAQMPNIELMTTPLVLPDGDRRHIVFGAGLSNGLTSQAKLFCILEGLDRQP